MSRPLLVPTWADSVGSNVVTGLTLTAATHMENKLYGQVLYGIIRFTCSGNPNLSAVLLGHRLESSGFDNAANNGTHEIMAANDADNWIEVRMTERLNNSLNETGASAAGAVTDSGALLKLPTSVKRELGYIPDEMPSSHELNSQLNLIGSWLDHYSQALPTGYDKLQAELVAGNNVTITNNGDGRQRIDAQINLSIIPAVGDTFTQNAHGFVIGTPVRHNGTAWVAAQGTTMQGCQGVRIVVERTTNTFKAVQIGRYTIAATTAGALSTALVAGDLLYLSKTSGAVTTVKPVGDPSAPLGFYLPLFLVESSGGGQAVIHVLGQPYPTFDPVLAEYLFTSTSSGATFTGLNSAVHGFYRAEIEVNVAAGPQEFLIGLNSDFSNAYHERLSAANSTVSALNSTRAAIGLSPSVGGVFQASVTISRIASTWLMRSEAASVYGQSSETTQQSAVSKMSATDISSLAFSGNTSNMYGAGSVIRLYRGKW